MEQEDFVSLSAFAEGSIDGTAEAFRRMKEASDGLQSIYEEHSKKLSEMEMIKKRFFEELGERGEEHLVKEANAKFGRFDKVVKALSDSSGEGLSSRIADIFCVIFRKIKSRTIEIYKFSDTEVLTVGGIGFGMRTYGSSRSFEVKSPTYILQMMEHKAKIIEALKKQNLHRWADKFERFCDIVPPELMKQDQYGVEIASFEFSSPVLLLHDCSGVGSKVEYGKKLVIEKRYSSSLNPKIVNDGRNDDFDLDFRRGCKDSLFAYYQFREQMDGFIKEFEERCAPNMAKAKTVLGKLKEEFGRELLMSEI